LVYLSKSPVVESSAIGDLLFSDFPKPAELAEPGKAQVQYLINS